jgi:hypothetical protein
MKKVRIKTWNEMVKVSKFHNNYRIELQEVVFLSDMESDLPTNRIIEVNDDGYWKNWTITDEMIAEVKENKTIKDKLKTFCYQILSVIIQYEKDDKDYFYDFEDCVLSYDFDQFRLTSFLPPAPCIVISNWGDLEIDRFILDHKEYDKLIADETPEDMINKLATEAAEQIYTICFEQKLLKLLGEIK